MSDEEKPPPKDQPPDDDPTSPAATGTPTDSRIMVPEQSTLVGRTSAFIGNPAIQLQLPPAQLPPAQLPPQQQPPPQLRPSYQMRQEIRPGYFTAAAATLHNPPSSDQMAELFLLLAHDRSMMLSLEDNWSIVSDAVVMDLAVLRAMARAFAYAAGDGALPYTGGLSILSFIEGLPNEFVANHAPEDPFSRRDAPVGVRMDLLATGSTSSFIAAATRRIPRVIILQTTNASFIRQVSLISRDNTFHIGRRPITLLIVPRGNIDDVIRTIPAHSFSAIAAVREDEIDSYLRANMPSNQPPLNPPSALPQFATPIVSQSALTHFPSAFTSGNGWARPLPQPIVRPLDETPIMGRHEESDDSSASMTANVPVDVSILPLVDAPTPSSPVRARPRRDPSSYPFDKMGNPNLGYRPPSSPRRSPRRPSPMRSRSNSPSRSNNRSRSCTPPPMVTVATETETDPPVDSDAGIPPLDDPVRSRSSSLSRSNNRSRSPTPPAVTGTTETEILPDTSLIRPPSDSNAVVERDNEDPTSREGDQPPDRETSNVSTAATISTLGTPTNSSRTEDSSSSVLTKSAAKRLKRKESAKKKKELEKQQLEKEEQLEKEQ